MKEVNFLHEHVNGTLGIPGDVSSGINECILKSTHNRTSRTSLVNRANKPYIIQIIKNPEMETAYTV